MRRKFLKIILPYQRPQVIELRWLPNNTIRTSIADRYDRVEWLNGEQVGFGILVFYSMRAPRIIRFTMRDDFSEAIYRNFEGQSLEVEIFAV